MKILVSQLPKNKWWGHGTPSYKNNPAMKEGLIPDQELVEIEMYLISKLFNRLPFEFIEINFPKYLDRQNKVERKHDFVFVRDLFISDQNSKIVISSFSEKERQIESDIMQEMLESMNYNTLRIPEKNNAKAEGGEFYYCKGSNLLFSGCCRNNRTGAEWIAQEFDVKDLLILQSDIFHLDTFFTPVINNSDNVVAVITCLDLMSVNSQIELKSFSIKHDFEIINIDHSDSIGNESELGDFSVNCEPLPGYLIGPARFRSSRVNAALKKLKVKHITIPTTQFRISGGGVHCLTNELY